MTVLASTAGRTPRERMASLTPFFVIVPFVVPLLFAIEVTGGRIMNVGGKFSWT